KVIFEKFTKLSRSNTYGDHFKGMGLGLYNSERDAEKIQATITVESEVGVGSTFEFRLPL
ncbi:MAG: ATP-binding protein, partial [Ignavibacteria bacterium]|nr:ATP-binding protein [Ignavibacteria bacterium]